MPRKFSAGSWGVTILSLGLMVTAIPAFAGFEWVAPNEGSVSISSSPNAPYIAPAQNTPSDATSMPEIISPVIISGSSKPVQVAPSYVEIPSPSAPSVVATPAVAPAPPAVVPIAVAPPAPLTPTTATSLPTPKVGKTDLATATISVSPAASNDIVQGFASQIPLALALRQLLPTGYNFSIDQDVDMNTLVSFKGGKSWRETLRDMLMPAGLNAHEQGTSITVSRNPASASAPPAPSLPPIGITKNVSQPSYLSLPSARAEVPATNVSVADGWSAERGDTLRKVLTDWCRRSNVELQWLAEYDYPIEASAHFNGGFEDAVRSLLAGFGDARPQPIGELHANANAGQMVLVVEARGNSYSN